MSKEQSIMVYEDTKTKTTRYEVNGVDITSSIEVLKEQFLNKWNNKHKLTTELSFYERNKYAKQISDLEAKLAESENKVKEYATEITRRNTEQLDMQTRSFLKIRDLDTEILKLKQQLAEKEKEIISLECVISEIHNDMKELHEFKVGEDEYDLTDSDARFSLECELLNKDQDKISFCIEQLEKVKEDILPDISIGIQREWISNKIDNQIKQLKEMNV